MWDHVINKLFLSKYTAKCIAITMKVQFWVVRLLVSLFLLGFLVRLIFRPFIFSILPKKQLNFLKFSNYLLHFLKFVYYFRNNCVVRRSHVFIYWKYTWSSNRSHCSCATVGHYCSSQVCTHSQGNCSIWLLKESIFILTVTSFTIFYNFYLGFC